MIRIHCLISSLPRHPFPAAHLKQCIQLGWDHKAVGDALLGHNVRQVLRVLLAARHRQHHLAAIRPWDEQLLLAGSRSAQHPLCTKHAHRVVKRWRKLTCTEASKLMGAFSTETSSCPSSKRLN